jgi:hypothetical protein
METESFLHYVYVLDFVYQKEGNWIIPTLCLCSRFCVSERGKLHHISTMFMFYVCVSERAKLYVYILYFVYQKGGNCMISTVCSWSRFYVSERRKLYHTCSMFMFYILCIRKRKNVSYIQYIYILSERGNTLLFLKYDYGLVLCISEQKNLHHTYSVLMIYSLCIRNRKTVSSLQCVYVLYFVHQK